MNKIDEFTTTIPKAFKYYRKECLRMSMREVEEEARCNERYNSLTLKTIYNIENGRLKSEPSRATVRAFVDICNRHDIPIQEQDIFAGKIIEWERRQGDNHPMIPAIG